LGRRCWEDGGEKAVTRRRWREGGAEKFEPERRRRESGASQTVSAGGRRGHGHGRVDAVVRPLARYRRCTEPPLRDSRACRSMVPWLYRLTVPRIRGCIAPRIHGG